MPYRVVEYSPVAQGRRPFSGRPHATVHYAGRSYGRLIPRVAHSRIVNVPPPSRFVRSQDIYSLGEEAYRLPYRTKVFYIEDATKYGNEYDIDSCHDLQQGYEAETRDLRRNTSEVLLRLAYGIPVPLYSFRNIPLRSASELKDIVDVRRKFVRERNNLSTMSRIQSEIYRMAMYQEPLRKQLPGKGNLACLSFAGGRPISKRQLRFYPEDNGMQDDISFRQFYNNLRVAATLGTFYKKPVTYQPLYKSKKSLLAIRGGDTEEKPRKAFESKWLTGMESSEKTQKSREIDQNFVLPNPRKSVIEIPKEVEAFVEPEIVVKIARKSIQEDYPIFPAAAETVKIAPRRIEQAVKEAEPIDEIPVPEPEPELEEVFEVNESKPIYSTDESHEPTEESAPEEIEMKPKEVEYEEPMESETPVEAYTVEPDAEPEVEPVMNETVEPIEIESPLSPVEPEPIPVDDEQMVESEDFVPNGVPQDYGNNEAEEEHQEESKAPENIPSEEEIDGHEQNENLDEVIAENENNNQEDYNDIKDDPEESESLNLNLNIKAKGTDDADIEELEVEDKPWGAANGSDAYDGNEDDEGVLRKHALSDKELESECDESD